MQRKRNGIRASEKRRGGRGLRVEHLEPRMLLAGDTYLVNFQFDEASIPTHYLRDVGTVFGDRGDGLSYGWSSDHTDQSRQRNIDPDLRFDTLIHFEFDQDWEFQLPNGNYEVTVAVGDPANNNGIHTINVENVSFFNAVPDTNDPMTVTKNVTVSDGRLTVDQGAAANMATRIDYIHIVGLADGPNASPIAPTITEPSMPGQVVNPFDVHMEAIGYFDSDGNAHKSSDWEIWTVGPGTEPVWQTLGIQGVERLHTHLGDGVFINAQAGETSLAANTDYELRVRYRDDAGSVSDYATRPFHTGAASTTFPMQIEDIVSNPAPTWESVLGGAVELPTGSAILSPGDLIIAIDTDPPDSDSGYPGDEAPSFAIDGTIDKYLNFGGPGSGFIVTPSESTTVQSFRLTTADDAIGRDPTSFQLWGTNDAIVSLDDSDGLGENWTLIDAFDLNGNLALPGARDTLGPVVPIANGTAYSSYKMLFPTLKGDNLMQIGEAQFFESNDGSGTDFLDAGDPILAVHIGPQSDYPGNENPSNAIDGTLAKYLNFGEANSGFIVTPSQGPSMVTSFQITTADDADERDPDEWAFYGTNSPIVSSDNSDGMGEPWTLIDSGTVDLPNARNTLGPIVSVDNDTIYTSYRMVFTSVRNGQQANSMQIGEIQFFGENAGTPHEMRIESGSTGDEFLTFVATESPGNIVNHFPSLMGHNNVRVVVQAGSTNLSLAPSNLDFEDEDGTSYTIYLPAVNLLAGQRLDLWVSNSGATYYGTLGQTAPDFSMLARQANLDIPYITTQPGYVIELVGTDYRLPVNIAFVENPGPNPDDPLYYVTELYGSIQVVTRDGTKSTFATGLLDYNPQGPISGSGEQGLTGIAVQRDALTDTYSLYVGMLWDNGDPQGGATHYPKVERIVSTAGGLTMASREVLLNMQPETQGQSHQISNISIGPDGYLYVHVGDGFDAGTAQDLDQYRGKILRMELDGDPVPENPFYDGGTEDPRDFIFAYGFRNPFGGAWRASDGKHYEVENGPSVDRLVQVNEGVNYLWDGSDASMFNFAIYNWNPSHAPVNMTFVQPETFAGSQFPESKQDHLFVAESGPTYATGPQGRGKRITEFVLDANGDLVSGPATLVEYVGTGKSSIVGLAAGPDGLYFSELYEDSGANGPTATGARIYRVRYINPLPGDYNIDGIVDEADHDKWSNSFDSNYLLAADGNGSGRIDPADYVFWRDRTGATLGSGAASVASAAPSVASSSQALTEDFEFSSSAPPAAFDLALEESFGRSSLPNGTSTGDRDGHTSESTSRAAALLLLSTTTLADDADDGPNQFANRADAASAEDESLDLGDLISNLQIELLDW